MTMLRILRWEINLNFPCRLNLSIWIRNGEPLLMRITEESNCGRIDSVSFGEWERHPTSQGMKVTYRSWKKEGEGD